MSRELVQPGRMVVGLDLSAEELALAAERGPGPWVRGRRLAAAVRRRVGRRGDQLDRAGGGQPLDRVIAEVTRVLRPGGVLAAIAPALRPLAPRDVRVLSRINTRLRTKPQFPGPVELTGFARTLLAHGMRRVEDARERYCFTVASRADAELMLSALYLPQTRWSRVEAATELLRGPGRAARPGRGGDPDAPARGHQVGRPGIGRPGARCGMSCPAIPGYRAAEPDPTEQHRGLTWPP